MPRRPAVRHGAVGVCQQADGRSNCSQREGLLSRDEIAERLQRAREAGAVGLIATTDWRFGKRLSPPATCGFRTRADVASRSRGSSRHTGGGWAPHRQPGRTSPGCVSSGTFRSHSRAWCASTTPNMLSTPGFRRSRCPTTAATILDGTPAAIRCLPAIAEEVGDQVEVLLDGGVGRGSDVVKTVALGALAVMICGRLWDLAAKGRPA